MTATRKLRLMAAPLLNATGYMAYMLCRHSLCVRLAQARALLYTAWLRNALRSVGRGTILYPGITLRGGRHISIGEMSAVGSHVILTAWQLIDGIEPKLTIGNGCDIGQYTHISCANRIAIGHGVLLGRWVTIVDNAHGRLCQEQKDMSPVARPIESKGGITIGDNVWIGDKATVLPGVSIGKGAIVAANSTVTKSVPAYTVVAGCPARVITTLSENKQE